MTTGEKQKYFLDFDDDSDEEKNTKSLQVNEQSNTNSIDKKHD